MQPTSKSKLDPYRPEIEQWERNGLSHREIEAKLLKEKGLKISHRSIGNRLKKWQQTESAPPAKPPETPAPAASPVHRVPPEEEPAHPDPKPVSDNATHTEQPASETEDPEPPSWEPLTPEVQDLNWPALYDEAPPPRHGKAAPLLTLFALALLIAGAYLDVVGNVTDWLSARVTQINATLSALYLSVKHSPILMAEIALVVAALALGLTWRAFSLALVLWLLHLSFEQAQKDVSFLWALAFLVMVFIRLVFDLLRFYQPFRRSQS